MILGVGIDGVHVYRMRRWEKVTGLFQRFFNEEELRSRVHTIQSYRFPG